MRYFNLFEYIDPDITAAKIGDKLQARLRADDSLAARFAQDDTDYDIAAEIRIISNHIDPTHNHIYTMWILRTYLKGGIRRYEDLSRVRAALTFFHENKRSMPEKDIGKFKSLVDLETAVDYADIKISGKKKKKEKSNLVRKQTTVVYKGPEGSIIIPTTLEASCFWGQGTKWCTASTGEYSMNYFDHYSKNGPLYIIMPADGTKWQFHFPSGQFMDVRDVDIQPKEFTKNYPWVVEQLPLSNSDWADAIAKNPVAFGFIKDPDLKLSKEIVLKNSAMIEHINNPSDEIIKIAVDDDAENLKYVNQTEELQWIALKSKLQSIYWIENPTTEMILFTIDNLFSDRVSETFRRLRDLTLTDNLEVQKAMIKKNLDIGLRYISNVDKELYLVINKFTSEQLDKTSGAGLGMVLDKHREALTPKTRMKIFDHMWAETVITNDEHRFRSSDDHPYQLHSREYAYYLWADGYFPKQADKRVTKDLDKISEEISEIFKNNPDIYYVDNAAKFYNILSRTNRPDIMKTYKMISKRLSYGYSQLERRGYAMNKSKALSGNPQHGYYGDPIRNHGEMVKNVMQQMLELSKVSDYD